MQFYVDDLDSITYSMNPDINRYSNMYLEHFRKIVAGKNMTIFAEFLHLDDFIQMDLKSQYPEECLELGELLRQTFKLYYTEPSIIFLRMVDKKLGQY